MELEIQQEILLILHLHQIYSLVHDKGQGFPSRQIQVSDGCIPRQVELDFQPRLQRLL